MRDFRKLNVWKDSVSFAKTIYQHTNGFPTKERFGLASQMQRAAVSIASNIAEGAARKSQVDFARFLEMSLGSAFELETQLNIAKEVGYLKEQKHQELLDDLTIIQKRINQFINKVRTKATNTQQPKTNSQQPTANSQ